MARPTVYTPELVKQICDRLCQGEPLEQICRDEGMPVANTIHEWCNEKTRPSVVPEHVKGDIAQAREIGYDAIANNTRAVANGIPGYSTGDVQRDKLIIETDLKLLAKWSKKYSERQTIDHTGNITLSKLVEDSMLVLPAPKEEVIEGVALPVKAEDFI